MADPDIPGLPPAAVRDSLMRLRLATKDKVAQATGEYGDRMKNMYELYPELDPKTWKRIYDPLMQTFETNELRAREDLRLARLALDAAQADMDRRGHYGDLAEQASQVEADAEPAAKPDRLSLDEAEAAFTATAHKAPTPAQSDAKVAKRRGRPPKNGTVTALAETAAEGDAHIRAVAAELDEGTNPERERAPTPNERDFGSYRTLS